MWLLAVVTAVSRMIAMLSSPLQDGVTPAYIASQEGKVGALQLLIAAGANVNTADIVRLIVELKDTKDINLSRVCEYAAFLPLLVVL